MPPKIGVEPADDDRHRGVRPHRAQEERCVLKLRVVMYGEKDQEAGERNGGRDEHKHEAMPEVVRGDRGGHREREGASPRWNGEQLCADGTVSEPLDDARRKVC